MNRLDNLVKDLCPNGVEFLKISKISNVLRGKRLTKKELNNDLEYPVFHGGLEPLGYFSESNRKANTTMVINVGASAGTIGYSNVDFWSSDGCYCIENKGNINEKYIYYALSKYECYFVSKVRYAGIPTLDAKIIEDFIIPVPPLPLQEEIVRILDNFTEITAELTAELIAELIARKKQYEYYRENLFKLENDKRFPMGDESIGQFIRGSGIQKKDFTETGVGCIHYGQIYTHYGTYTNITKTFISKEFAKKARKAKYGNLVIATTSENDEDVCKAVVWLGEEEIAISSDACFYTHNLNPKYVAYFFKTEQFQKQKRLYITGTKVRRVNVDNLAKIKIPVPPLEEQERIVSILDQFDALVNDISQGLPAEIESRKKQYEYYRDKLLTFKNIDAEV